MIPFLAKAPFNLDEAQIRRVRDLCDALTLEQRVSQLFILLLLGEDPADREAVLRFRPGGITRFFGPDLAHERSVMAAIEQALPIKPLVTADLEGSRQSLGFGTAVPNQLGMAAIDDTKTTYQMASITAREARALGVRWSFTPVVDINAAFRSAIVATRSYGREIERIERHALAHIQGLQDNGMAATVKHWPGEGYDDRDQHLVTTINPLVMDEWDATFGRLYRSAIEAGVMSVMAAHIALPELVCAHFPDAGVEAYRPASINRLITHDLLRDRLGFNGIVVSDATEMAGLGAFMKEPEVMPELLAAGCDVILFSRQPERDREAILTALAQGRLSHERVEDAVLRVLGLKEKLGLLTEEALVPEPAEQRAQLARRADVRAARDAFARSPTLEKDTQGLFPLELARHRRIMVFEGPIPHPLLPEPPRFSLPAMLEEEGFDVTRFTRGAEVTRARYDLVLYLLGTESLLTRSHNYIDWAELTGGGIGGALRRYWHEIPTLMISFGHPYHLYDAPRVPTYVNAWSTHEDAQAAVLDCLMGRRPWQGTHPVDAFCGLGDAKY